MNLMLVAHVTEETAKGDQGGSAFPLITGILSLLTAVVVVVGPPLMKKWFPSKDTLSEIALNSTNSTNEHMKDALNIMRNNLGGLDSTVKSMDSKLDRFLRESGKR